jgi:plasmid segregation protein ParM
MSKPQTAKVTAAVNAAAGKVITVGVDDGFAMTKVIILEDGVVTKSLMIPSRARPGVHGISVIGSDIDSGPVPCYETEGTKFTVGDLKDAETARFDAYPYSSMNRVIIHHALRVAGLSGQDVRIATGLTLKMFYKNGEPNAELIAKKDASIRLPVVSADASAVANIVEHAVYPEGLAAWVDYAVGDDGKVRVNLQETVAVIDIGGRTTDVAVILPSKQIDHARLGADDVGVLDVIESVRGAVLRKYDVDLPVNKADEALRTRTFTMWGKPVDIAVEVDAAIAQVFDTVMRSVNRALGKGSDIDRILLVGGGAHVFKDVASVYPNIVIPKDPEYANARGFAKYLSL